MLSFSASSAARQASRVTSGLPRHAAAAALPGSRRHFSTSPTARTKDVRVGCASGFWGDTPTAPHQLIHGGKLDYLVFDYLSELTMSLLTASKQKKPELGYVPDFGLYGVGPYLNDIKSKGIRVVTNAGGINTEACVAGLRAACKKAGVDLKIAAVHGDNLMPNLEKMQESGEFKEMYTGAPLPFTTHSMTAYFGAGPIIKALEMGADIVVTGRTADSALALAPLMHEFKWTKDDYDKLASGSLAGHLIECGGQATGGLFTDWHLVKDYDKLGFPVCQVSSNGDISVSKPPGTGGLLNKHTVAEQLLYEIGDPRSYILPDVVCDFSNVTMTDKDTPEGNEVLVVGAKGKAPTDSYKVSATYLDGFRGNAVCVVAGGKAADKGRVTTEAIMKRSSMLLKRKGLDDFERTYLSVIGSEDSFGKNATNKDQLPREAIVWMGVAHKDADAIKLWSREIASAGTGMTPGLCAIIGGRPKPIPCLKLFSFLYPKSQLASSIEMDDQKAVYQPDSSGPKYSAPTAADKPVCEPVHVSTGTHTYTLEELAYARSGDKGNSCNIGVVARHPAYLPYIKNALTNQSVGEYFEHLFNNQSASAAEGKTPEELVTRFDLPGIHGVNFLLENVLDGGGIASLRPDPLGKGFAQMLLSFNVGNMPSLEEIERDYKQ